MNSAITSQIGNPQLKNFRNKIINGDFLYWQRLTSFSNDSPADAYSLYTADRWRVVSEPDGGFGSNNGLRQTFTVGQTDVPCNPTYYYQIQNYTDSGGDNARNYVYQPVENVINLQGRKATVSFYAKGSASGTVKVSLVQNFGTGGSPSSTVYGSAQSISLTTSWKRFYLTFDVASISGKVLGSNNNDFLGLYFWTHAGSTASTSYNLGGAFSLSTVLYLANVQLEEGSQATDFEVLSREVRLSLCQRYYEKSHRLDTVPGSSYDDKDYLITSQCPGGGTYWIPNMGVRFQVAKRVAPVMTTWDAVQNINKWTMLSTTLTLTNDLSFASSNANEFGFNVLMQGALVNTGMVFAWEADAEF